MKNRDAQEPIDLDEIGKDIKQRVKLVMRLRKLSQVDVERDLPIGQTTMSGWLQAGPRGRIPRSNMLSAFCKHYNINGHWMLTGDGDMELRPKKTTSEAYTQAGETVLGILERVIREIRATWAEGGNPAERVHELAGLVDALSGPTRRRLRAPARESAGPRARRPG